MTTPDPATYQHPPVARPAPVDAEILDVLAGRWSPRAFDPSAAVAPESVRRLFEAARWAPSSANEQPWRFLLFDSEVADAREAARDCLTKGNQWARAAPVLILTLVTPRWQKWVGVNRAALHDLGAASLSMALQAQAEELILHQMAGFDRERAREVFALPEEVDPVTMIAVGHPGPVEALSEFNQERERAPRQRRPVRESVAHGAWNTAFEA